MSDPIIPDFFTTHEDRDVENEPELNTGIDSMHGCRRSARQSNMVINNHIDESIIGTGHDDSLSTSNRNTTNSSNINLFLIFLQLMKIGMLKMNTS